MDLFPSLGDLVITGFCILFSYWSIWWLLQRYSGMEKMFEDINCVLLKLKKADVLNNIKI